MLLCSNALGVDKGYQ